MSDPNSSPVPRTRPAKTKKKTSPARNAIGLVLLVAAVAVAWSQFSAVRGYNAAVRSLEDRTQDEEQNLLTVDQVEKMISRTPDGPEVSLNEGNRTVIKKTYTWRGLIKSYTLTAFYVKESDVRLLRFETAGAETEEAAQ